MKFIYHSLKKRILTFLSFALIFSFGFIGYKQPKVDTNAKIKAVFLYNFTKYIEWPSSYKSGNFVVGVLGANSSLYKELSIMSRTKKVANQDFEIQTYKSISEIDEKVHILYVPDEESPKLKEAIQKLNGKSTLIVTESPGLSTQGAGINFVIVDNRQKFELNKSNVERHNLKVSKSLEDLALVVK